MSKSLFLSLLKGGVAAQQKEHTKKEQEQLQTLRIGEAGLIVTGDDGKDFHTGKCMRLSILRYLGYEKNFDFSTLLGFEAGFGNEFSWEADIKDGLEAEGLGGRLLLGDDAIIEYDMGDGAKLRGHLDLVVEYPDGSRLGGELKNIQSVYSAGNRLQGSPDLGHLVQAASYFFHGGFDKFELLYTQRALFHTGTMFKKEMFQELSGKFPSYFDYNAKGLQSKMRQFILTFRLVRDCGVILFEGIDHEGNVVYPLKESIVTQAGILEYHRRVREHGEAFLAGNPLPLPEKPVNLDPFGVKGNWNLCGYCDLKEHCKEYECDSMQWKNKLPSSVVRYIGK